MPRPWCAPGPERPYTARSMSPPEHADDPAVLRRWAGDRWPERLRRRPAEQEQESQQEPAPVGRAARAARGGGSAQGGGGGQGRGASSRSGSNSRKRPSGGGGRRSRVRAERIVLVRVPAADRPTPPPPVSAPVERTSAIGEETAVIGANRRRAARLALVPGLFVGVVVGVVMAALGLALVAVLVFLVVTALVALWWWRRAPGAVLRSLGARPSMEADRPRLHNLVDGLCATMGLAAPAISVVDSECPTPWPSGTTRARPPWW